MLPHIPTPEVKATSEPPPSCLRMTADAARKTVNVPLRWVSMTPSHSSSDMLNSIRSRRMPATVTTPSMRPNFSTAVDDDALAGRHRRDVVGEGDRRAAGGLDLLDDRVGDLARRLGAVHARRRSR